MDGLIYTNKLDSFTRKYYVTNNNVRGLTKKGHAMERNLIISDISEQFLYYNGIAFYVFGENIPLTVLIDIFGVSGLENLLEQSAIEFVFNTPTVMYNVDDVEGMMPLVASHGFASKAHSDPEESVTLGFNWLRTPLQQRVKRKIIKKVIKAYRTPSGSIANDATKFGIEGYNNNLFHKFGMPKDKDISNLNKDEREKLCSFAKECVTLSILSELNYNSIDSFYIAELVGEHLENLKKTSHVKEATNRLFELENLPNFSVLMQKGIIDYKDIPKLRKSKNSIKFRNWLNSTLDTSDTVDIVNEYLNSIEKTKGILEKEPWRVLKTLGIVALSGAAGGAIASSINGAAIGMVAGIAADLGLSTLDTYVLSGLLRGWNPRHYFTGEIKTLMSNK